jgi:hypothetical protein
MSEGAPSDTTKAMRLDAIEAMRFHGPGWSLTRRDGALYQLWAPQDGEITDPHAALTVSTDREPRSHWAASWQSGDGESGNFMRGKSAEDVLCIFPSGVRQRFVQAVTDAR